jgi:hypothetical protein
MVKYVGEILAAWDKVEPKIDKEGFEKVQSKQGRRKQVPLLRTYSRSMMIVRS